MMHVIHHDLGVELARRAAMAAWHSYEQRYAKYHPTLIWEDQTRARVSIQVRGLTLRAEVQFTPETLELDLEVPLILRVFKSRAAHAIDAEVDRWLARARAGEL